MGQLFVARCGICHRELAYLRACLLSQASNDAPLASRRDAFWPVTTRVYARSWHTRVRDTSQHALFYARLVLHALH